MTTQPAAGGEWHTQLGTWLGAVAIALALYALLRDNPNTRQADSELARQTADLQLRDTIVKLQDSLSRQSSSAGERVSGAQGWLYFQSAQEMIAKKRATPSLAGYLVLANFALAHSDVALGNQFLTAASAEVKRETSPVTQSLARAAMAHFMFEHAPTTSLDEGRRRYAEAVDEASQLSGQGAPLVLLSILQEWALDEFAAGNVDAGNEQHAAAIKLLGNETFTPAYRTHWEQEMDTAIIAAKVRGRLL